MRTIGANVKFLLKKAIQAALEFGKCFQPDFRKIFKRVQRLARDFRPDQPVMLHVFPPETT